MNDFEERLTRALRGAAERAPGPEILTRRQRRHTVPILLAVAATLAAMAVPAGVIGYLHQRGVGPSVAGTGSPTVATSPTALPTITTGWRAESWHGVTLNVPGSWGYGAIHGCWDDAATPLVDRPGGYRKACLRTGWGYGVAFLSPDDYGSSKAVEIEPVDPDATLHMVQTNDEIVVIITKDKETADAIAASVRNYTGLDPNGCAPTATVPELGTASSLPGQVFVGQASLCRYTMAGQGSTDARLLQSDLLTASQTRQLQQALDQAPAGTGPDASPSTCLDRGEDEAVLARVGGTSAWIHYAGCVGHGVDLGSGTTRELTSEVLYWALMPGWTGSVGGSVPLRERLRTR